MTMSFIPIHGVGIWSSVDDGSIKSIQAILYYSFCSCF